MPWIYHTPRPHICPKPYLHTDPGVRIGDIWMCGECQTLYRAESAGLGFKKWRIAGWWTKRKHREAIEEIQGRAA